RDGERAALRDPGRRADGGSRNDHGSDRVEGLPIEVIADCRLPNADWQVIRGERFTSNDSRQ
ncbi:MAG TPA: hypothetical protein VE135_12910, partial [Pyrinomonadaceae bacterium]|nr:hypothetical protein [Pyrinomonadaceae bacterium]